MFYEKETLTKYEDNPKCHLWKVSKNVNFYNISKIREVDWH